MPFPCTPKADPKPPQATPSDPASFSRRLTFGGRLRPITPPSMVTDPLSPWALLSPEGAPSRHVAAAMQLDLDPHTVTGPRPANGPPGGHAQGVYGEIHSTHKCREGGDKFLYSCQK